MAPAGKGRSKASQIITKEDVLSALLIADDFESSFGILEEDEPKILMPLVNATILDYTLEFLHISGVQNVVIFCSNYPNKVKDFICKSKWSNALNMTISVTISEACMSVGDAIRDVYDKRLITDDFVLLIGGVVSNIQLKPLVDSFRELKKKDKSTVMTALFSRPSISTTKSSTTFTAVAYDDDTKRILFLQNLENNSNVLIPLDVFLDNNCVEVCNDFIDSRINICSAEVLSLFADNFDYQTRNDFIKGSLVHEEVLGNTIYLNIIEDGYAVSVSDFPSYRSISHDVIGRWVNPITPDQILLEDEVYLKQLRHNIYKHPDVDLNNCKLVSDVVIGKMAKLGADCFISKSVIGENCEIGSGVRLNNAFVWPNAKIGSNCNIDSAIIAANAVVGDDVDIFNCILGEKVKVENKTQLKDCFKSAQNLDYDDVDGDDDKDSEDENAIIDPWNLNSQSDKYSSSEDDREMGNGSDEEDGGRLSAELDDTNIFYNELHDTLIRGLKENLSSDNLILEINSLKYAYNVTVTEVNHLLTKAVLVISEIDKNPKDKLPGLKQLLKQFHGIFTNYLKSQTSQMDVLNSLKEFAIESTSFITTIANVIHFLYEKELIAEEVIVSWYTEHLLEDDESEKEIKLKVTPFIKWLEEAEEETEESD